jgi:hypothetical protein
MIPKFYNIREKEYVIGKACHKLILLSNIKNGIIA